MPVLDWVRTLTSTRWTTMFRLRRRYLSGDSILNPGSGTRMIVVANETRDMRASTEAAMVRMSHARLLSLAYATQVV